MSDTSAIEDRTKTRFWNQLVDLIAKGNVVPIVGEELLQLPGEPEGTTLYQTLAKRYAVLCGIGLEDQFKGNLSAMVPRHPDFRLLDRISGAISGHFQLQRSSANRVDLGERNTPRRAR